MSHTEKFPLLNHPYFPRLTDFDPAPFVWVFLLTPNGWKIGNVGRVRLSTGHVGEKGFYRPVYVEGHCEVLSMVLDWQPINYPPLPPG